MAILMRMSVFYMRLNRNWKLRSPVGLGMKMSYKSHDNSIQIPQGWEMKPVIDEAALNTGDLPYSDVKDYFENGSWCMQDYSHADIRCWCGQAKDRI
jgi:hypothetical protein